jgi:hypothetical protein
LDLSHRRHHRQGTDVAVKMIRGRASATLRWALEASGSR